jgi:hypothetical protein
MKGCYSPYNRSYKFICLQNQLAHVKNKSSVKSLTKTNISFTSVPEKPLDHSLQNLSSNLLEPTRELHLQEYYKRRMQHDQNCENERFAKRLCNISCRVITTEKAKKEFSQHLSYKSIATRYSEGHPKELIRLDGSLTSSKVQSCHSPTQFCTVVGTKTTATPKRSQKSKPRSKIIRLY